MGSVDLRHSGGRVGAAWLRLLGASRSTHSSASDHHSAFISDEWIFPAPSTEFPEYPLARNLWRLLCSLRNRQLFCAQPRQRIGREVLGRDCYRILFALP